MNINYDAQTDSLYINLSHKPGVDSKVLSDDVVVDFGEHGEPVGIDIQHASKTLNLTELIAHNMPTKKIAVETLVENKLVL